MSVLIPFLLTVHVIVCLLLVLVVLMQLPRSEGLGAAFGGGVTENIFGAQTTHVLAKFTVWLGVAFFVITLMLAVAYTHRDSDKAAALDPLLNAPVPTASASPIASPAPVAVPDAAIPAASPAASAVASPAQ